MIRQPGMRIATGAAKERTGHCGHAFAAGLLQLHRRAGLPAAASPDNRVASPRAQGLRCGTIDPTEVARAPAEFDPVCESLTSREQARLLQLLINQIDYDWVDGVISIMFHPTGINARVERQTEEGTA